MLVWIAYRLLIPDEASADAAHANSVRDIWSAIRTIIIADAVMGVDNVLGVAAAAQGSFALVVLGLAISIPIVAWGSTLILRLIERFPSFVYLGAAVLAWTAARMITTEPWLTDAYAAHFLTIPMIYAVTVFGVLWAGLSKNHRRLESRISARLSAFEQQAVAAAPQEIHRKGEGKMLKVLVPVNDSPNSRFAVRDVIREYQKNTTLELHLLNVQPPFSRLIASFVPKANRDSYRRERRKRRSRRFGGSSKRPGSRSSSTSTMGQQGGGDRRRCSPSGLRPDRDEHRAQELAHPHGRGFGHQPGARVDERPGPGDRRQRGVALERFGIPAAVGAGLVLLYLAGD